MLTPTNAYYGLTPEQQGVLSSPYDMMGPGITRYDPLRLNAYTGGQLGYMPQAQFLTPASYGAFRTMPGPGEVMPNQNAGWWQNALVANHGFGWFRTYNPAVNQQLYRATASRDWMDANMAIGANVADLFASMPLTGAIGIGAKGIARTLGVGATWAGRIGFGAALGAGFVLPSLATPFVDRIREARAIQRSTMSKIVSGPDVDPLTGMGFSSAISADMDRFIRREGADNILFKEGDYRNLLNLGMQYGMFDFSNSAQQYKDKLRKLRDNFTTAMEVLGSSDFRDILSAMQRMQNMGASMGQFNDILRAENAFSRMTGISHQEMVNTYGQQGAVLYSQVGLDGYRGSLRNMANAAAMTLAQRQGLVSEAQLARWGGVTGYAQTATEQSARAESLILPLIAANVMDKEFKGFSESDAREFVEGINSGRMTLQDMYNRLADRNTLARVNAFDMNHREAYSQFMAKIGSEGQENQLMQMARIIGEAIERHDATTYQKFVTGMRMMGFDPQIAHQQVVNYLNPDRQAQLDRERDLDRIQKAEDWRNENMWSSRTIREIRSTLHAISDAVYGNVARDSIKFTDEYAKSRSRVLGGESLQWLFTQSSMRVDSPTAGTPENIRTDLVGRQDASAFWNADKPTREQLQRMMVATVAVESSGKTKMYDAITRVGQYKGLDALTFGPYQLHTGAGPVDKFYEEMDRIASDSNSPLQDTAKQLMSQLFGDESFFDDSGKVRLSDLRMRMSSPEFEKALRSIRDKQYNKSTYDERIDSVLDTAGLETYRREYIEKIKDSKNAYVSAMRGDVVMSAGLIGIATHRWSPERIEEFWKSRGYSASDVATMDETTYRNLAPYLHAYVVGDSDHVHKYNKVLSNALRAIPGALDTLMPSSGTYITAKEYWRKAAQTGANSGVSWVSIQKAYEANKHIRDSNLDTDDIRTNRAVNALLQSSAMETAPAGYGGLQQQIESYGIGYDSFKKRLLARLHENPIDLVQDLNDPSEASSLITDNLSMIKSIGFWANEVMSDYGSLHSDADKKRLVDNVRFLVATDPMFKDVRAKVARQQYESNALSLAVANNNARIQHEKDLENLANMVAIPGKKEDVINAMKAGVGALGGMDKVALYTALESVFSSQLPENPDASVSDRSEMAQYIERHLRTLGATDDQVSSIVQSYKNGKTISLASELGFSEEQRKALSAITANIQPNAYTTATEAMVTTGSASNLAKAAIDSRNATYEAMYSSMVDVTSRYGIAFDSSHLNDKKKVDQLIAAISSKANFSEDKAAEAVVGSLRAIAKPTHGSAIDSAVNAFLEYNPNEGIRGLSVNRAAPAVSRDVWQMITSGNQPEKPKNAEDALLQSSKNLNEAAGKLTKYTSGKNFKEDAAQLKKDGV